MRSSEKIESVATYGAKRKPPETVFLAVSLVCVTLLNAPPMRAYASDGQFDDALRLAHAYDPDKPPSDVPKDRLKAAEHYRRALQLRPDNPQNLDLSFQLGANLLAMDGDRNHQLEGLAVAEDLLSRYRYIDYYQKDHEGLRDNPEYKMVYAAIHAGETRQYLLKDSEKARSHYFRGMEMLNQTYWRRLEDWKKEPRPEQPSSTGLISSSELKWESRLEAWETKQNRAEAGDVFDPNLEGHTVKSLVRHYVETYGRFKPEEVAGILQPAIDAFPNSPFDKEARRIIAIANAKAKQRVEKAAMSAISGGLDASVPAPVVQQAAVQVPPAITETGQTESKATDILAAVRRTRTAVWACIASVLVATCIGGLWLRSKRIGSATKTIK